MLRWQSLPVKKTQSTTFLLEPIKQKPALRCCLTEMKNSCLIPRENSDHYKSIFPNVTNICKAPTRCHAPYVNTGMALPWGPGTKGLFHHCPLPLHWRCCFPSTTVPGGARLWPQPETGRAFYPPTQLAEGGLSALPMSDWWEMHQPWGFRNQGSPRGKETERFRGRKMGKK